VDGLEPLRGPEGSESEGFLRLAWRRYRRDRLAVFGLVLLGLIILQALVAPAIAEHLFGLDPYRQTLTQRYRPPSFANPLGTDELGRDALARLLEGGRVSLAFGLVVGAISLAIGVPLGLAAGYYGGRTDDVANAVIGTLQTIPTLFLLILLSVTFRPPFLLLAVLFGVIGWTGIARQVRGVALSLRERQYVEAARALGASEAHLIARHLLPNVASVVLVLASFDVAGAILGEAGLSFLGFGVQVPTPSWGNLLQRSLDNVTRAPWLIAAPGVMIFLTVLALFLVADGLRDALDPRLEG
jgi:peptide/nickel transport system permease protein